MSRVTLFHGKKTKNQQHDFPRYYIVTGAFHFSSHNTKKKKKINGNTPKHTPKPLKLELKVGSNILLDFDSLYLQIQLHL